MNRSKLFHVRYKFSAEDSCPIIIGCQIGAWYVDR